jgi:hypothetical protein
MPASSPRSLCTLGIAEEESVAKQSVCYKTPEEARRKMLNTVSYKRGANFVETGMCNLWTRISSFAN